MFFSQKESRTGSRPMQSMQMQRSEKSDACIGQIFTTNIEKQHFWRIRKAFNAHILTKLFFVEMNAKHEIYTSECSKMQLRVIVKKFSDALGPLDPQAKLAPL